MPRRARLPYTRIDAGLEHGKNTEPWYLALNPNGKIPLLTDGAFTLWESNTIVRYLAGKHGLGGLCPASLETRALAERWMDWQLSTLITPVSIVFQNLLRRPAAERDAAAVERNTREANHAMTLLDAHLAGAALRRRATLHDGRYPRRRVGAPLARDPRHRAAAVRGHSRVACAPRRAGRLPEPYPATPELKRL